MAAYFQREWNENVDEIPPAAIPLVTSVYSTDAAEESHQSEENHHSATTVNEDNGGGAPADEIQKESENQRSSAVAGPSGTTDTEMIIPESAVPMSFDRNHTIRSILAEVFRRGMPEECILIILREVLVQLSYWHGQGEVHNMVTAGHVYYQKTVRGSATIMLGMPVAVRHDVGSSSMYADPELISQWGRAPELASNEPTANSDIWLLGIMALELAFGGLKFRNSQELYDQVLAMQKKHKISKKWIRLPFGCFPIEIDKVCSFSRHFHRLVLRCLDLNPDTRVTANDLLQEEAFTTLTSDVSFLSHLIDEHTAHRENAIRAARQIRRSETQL